MSDEEWITQREFARRVGVSQPAVNKVIGKRITARADGKINWATEEKNWYANRDPSKMRAHNAPKDAGQHVEALGQAKLAKEVFAGKLRQLEYEQRAGNLVPWKDIEERQREADIMIMNHLLEIPGRVSAGLASSLIDYLRAYLPDHLPKAKVDTIISGIDTQAIELRVFAVWDTESKKVINEIGADLRGRAGE